MLDNFREWLSDNLRYIMLGAAILIVILGVMFGVKSCAKNASQNKEADKKNEQQKDKNKDKNKDNKKDDKKDNTDKEDNTDNKDDQQEDDEDTGNDVKPTEEPKKQPEVNFNIKNSSPDITAVVTEYYQACSNKDIEGIRKIYEGLTESDISKIKNNDKLEAYSDIGTYVKAGPVKGSYLVFVEYKIKYKDINTLAPGLARLYLYTDDKGNLRIVNEVDDPVAEAAIEAATQEKEVQELVQRVSNDYLDAQNADPALKKFLEGYGATITAASKADIGATITAAKSCNVRKGPGTTYDAMGDLKVGQQVVKKGSDGDWIMIELNGQTGYVRKDMFQ